MTFAVATAVPLSARFRRAPPGLMGAGLYLWGAATDLLWLGIAAGLAVEFSRLIRHRWAIAADEWTRLTDLLIVLTIGTAMVFVLEEEEAWLFETIRLLPLLCLPLPLAQHLSQDGLCRTRSERPRGPKDGRAASGIPYDATLGYTLLCLVSAGTLPDRPPSLLLGMGGTLFWLAWSVRPRAWRDVHTLLCLLAAAGIAAAIATSLSGTGPQLGRWALSLVANWSSPDVLPNRSDTAIGSVGTLKLSDRIVLRVAEEALPPQGAIFRLATYRFFNRSTWYAGQGQDTRVPATPSGTWTIAEVPEPMSLRTVRITAFLPRSRAILPLPPGTAMLSNLEASRLTIGPLGPVNAEGLASPVFFQAHVASDVSRDPPPNTDDLYLRRSDARLFRPLARELGLLDLSDQETVRRVEQYFADGFRYSLYQDEPSGLAALERFLTETRKGHCEYFATATALLLRAAGIPARYAVGYVVRERDPWENEFLVRRRHGHAWVLAHVEGRWIPVDTTPAIWADLEQASMPRWRVIADLWAWLGYRFNRWQSGPDGQAASAALPWLLIPGFLFLVWRLTGNARRRRPVLAYRRNLNRRRDKLAGFGRIEHHLSRRGWTRASHEPLERWVRSVPPTAVSGHAALIDLVQQHYRLRFAVPAASEQAHAQLDERIDRWLAQNGGGEPSR